MIVWGRREELKNEFGGAKESSFRRSQRRISGWSRGDMAKGIRAFLCRERERGEKASNTNREEEEE